MTIPRLMRLKNFYYCRARKFPLRLLWYDLDLSTIPEGTAFPHPYGITLNTTARWGQGCQVRQNVTLGNRWKSDGSEPGAVIGNGVQIDVGALILGPVTIGNGAEIGAGAVVLRDVPGYMVAVGNPARIVGRNCTRKFLAVFRQIPLRATRGGEIHAV